MFYAYPYLRCFQHRGYSSSRAGLAKRGRRGHFSLLSPIAVERPGQVRLIELPIFPTPRFGGSKASALQLKIGSTTFPCSPSTSLTAPAGRMNDACRSSRPNNRKSVA
jgi:hypothetical protein